MHSQWRRTAQLILSCICEESIAPRHGFQGRIARRCRQYALLEMSDEEAEAVEPPPAPTTSALPKRKEKHIRRKPEAAAVEAEREAEEPLQLGRRRKRDWEEDEGGLADT